MMKPNTTSLMPTGLLLAALSLFSFAAGPLAPPGAPGDGTNGGPSLTEIKTAVDAVAAAQAAAVSSSALLGRTPLAGGVATVNINASGNYILTGDITAAAGHGINITADNVTLDLNGFTVRSAPVVGTAGIMLNGGKGVKIRNGRIVGNFTGAGPSGSSFFGIFLSNPAGTEFPNGLVLEDLTLTQGANIRGAGLAPTVIPSVVCRRISLQNSSITLGGIAAGSMTYFGKAIDCEGDDTSSISAALVVNCITGSSVSTQTRLQSVP